MGFLGRIVRGVCDIATAPLKAAGQVLTGVGKGIGALAQGDIGGFFGETFKGIAKGGGELIHGTLSGVKNLAGPVLTVGGALVGGVAGFCLGGPFGAAAGVGLGGMLGNKLGNAIGGVAGSVDNAVGNGLGLYGFEGGQQACGQQNYNDFGCGYNSSYPSYGCGNQLPYSFYQGAQGYPNCQPQWCPPPCNYRPPYYNAAPGNCCCW